jgi:Uma2 family endonuclease
LAPVKTVVLGDQPPEIVAFLARRRALGQDGFDEVWEGDYHVVPAPHLWHGYVDRAVDRVVGPLAEAAGLFASSQFNLGDPGDYRVPDGGYHRGILSEVFVPTAAIVVEILSPNDETWAKFDFYARHGVDEICVADPVARADRWFVRSGLEYVETGRSDLLGVAAADLTARITWPG